MTGLPIEFRANHFSMKHTLIVLLTLLLATTVSFANVQKRRPQKPAAIPVSSAEKEEWEKLKRRFAKYEGHISGLAYTLIHAYKSETEMKRGVEILEAYGLAMAGDDPKSIRKFNGPAGIKQRLLNLTNSKDDTVSSFAAIMLAIIGDPNHAPAIAGLLDRHGKAVRDADHEISIRGHAATALGLLGATQYSSRIAALLKSENRYDREGAATALGLLKATDYAKDVADTLSSASVGSWDDDSPIRALLEMGVAANYKKEIARVLHSEIPGDRSKTAAYALVRLGAKEHAKDIALLLKDNVKKGDAAKALALLGSSEYTAEIVLLLENENSTIRKDGAVALGVLGAKQHAAAVAKLLKDFDPRVSTAAAQALVLLEANEYAKEVLEIIAQQKDEGYLDAGAFDEIVNEQILDLDKRFKNLLARMKRHVQKTSQESPRLGTGSAAM